MIKLVHVNFVKMKVFKASAKTYTFFSFPFSPVPYACIFFIAIHQLYMILHHGEWEDWLRLITAILIQKLAVGYYASCPLIWWVFCATTYWNTHCFLLGIKVSYLNILVIRFESTKLHIKLQNNSFTFWKFPSRVSVLHVFPLISPFINIYSNFPQQLDNKFVVYQRSGGTDKNIVGGI